MRLQVPRNEIQSGLHPISLTGLIQSQHETFEGCKVSSKTGLAGVIVAFPLRIQVNQYSPLDTPVLRPYATPGIQSVG